MKKVVVVTRHKALVEYLKEKNIVDENVEVIDHVEDVSQIKNKHVIGVLPINLAAYCNTITIVPLIIPKEMRGKELSLDDIKNFAGEISTYYVKKI